MTRGGTRSWRRRGMTLAPAPHQHNTTTENDVCCGVTRKAKDGRFAGQTHRGRRRRGGLRRVGKIK